MKVRQFFVYLLLFIFSKNFSHLPKTSEPIHAYEPFHIKQQAFKTGSLTVICGSMCSGKSEELIKQVGRFILAGFNVLVLKPAIDNRKILNLNQDPLTYIPSRNGSWINCLAISSIDEMKKMLTTSNATVIAIDEAHFFIDEQDDFIELIHSLIEENKKVIIAGLDLDFRAEPFGPMPKLMAYADNVIKLTAICTQCGNDVFCITQRLINGHPAHYNDPLIVVGTTQYEPRCRSCHIILKD
ncbi:thymidine kinase [Candidatus Dependentiae bacterium]|nr:thymidine kinase [Candidatus Dependentiae bacterium]